MGDYEKSQQSRPEFEVREARRRFRRAARADGGGQGEWVRSPVTGQLEEVFPLREKIKRRCLARASTRDAWSCCSRRSARVLSILSQTIILTLIGVVIASVAGEQPGLQTSSQPCGRRNFLLS